MADLGDPRPLDGRRILITGAAGAVGQAAALRMIEAGGDLVLTDIDQEGLEAFAGRLRAAGHPAERVHWVASDLSGAEGVARVFAYVDEQFDGLDVLVACAAIGSPPLLELTESQWRAVIETNLVASVACTQGAIDRMLPARSDGMVILVGSISVHIKAVGESVYNAAKGGLASFAETLRKELISLGLRITLIEPGAIASSMQPFSEEERARLLSNQKMLAPEQVAEAIMFAATRPPGVDVVTLRLEPLDQKIW